MVTFPDSPDALTNPNPTDPTTSATVPHAQQHATINDIVEAVMAKLGSGASNQAPAASRVLGGDGAGQTSYRQIANADVSPAAGIAYSKLAMAGSVGVGDLAPGTPSRVFTTDPAGIPVIGQIPYAGIPGGGATNRVLATVDGSSVGMLQAQAVMTAPGHAMTLIRDTTLAAPAGAIVFSSLSQVFRSLYIVALLRTDAPGVNQTISAIQVNSSGGDTYAWVRTMTYTTPVAVASAVRQPSLDIGNVPSALAQPGMMATCQILIPDYARTWPSKPILCSNGYRNGAAFYPVAGEMVNMQQTGFWSGDQPITEVVFYPGGGNFVAGCRVSVYGLPSALVTL